MTDWEGREKGASCADSGGTASPKSDGLCKSEGGATEDREWFWRIVDADGFADLPSDEPAALRILSHRVLMFQTLCSQLASAWFYGGWKAETRNERDMEALMRRAGWWPIRDEADLVGRKALYTCQAPAESNASSPNEVSASALPPDEPTILNSSIPKSAGKESAP